VEGEEPDISQVKAWVVIRVPVEVPNLQSLDGYRMTEHIWSGHSDWTVAMQEREDNAAEAYSDNAGTGAASRTTPAKSGERTAPASTSVPDSAYRCHGNCCDESCSDTCTGQPVEHQDWRTSRVSIAPDQQGRGSAGGTWEGGLGLAIFGFRIYIYRPRHARIAVLFVTKSKRCVSLGVAK
jgi:hypothetical protein